MAMLKRMAIAVAVLFALNGAVAAQADCPALDLGLDAYNAGDDTTALAIWRPCAEQGNAVAQYNLGLMYRNGYGVAQDFDRQY